MLNMMHNRDDMQDLLTGLSLHYPQARHTDAQLAALAEDWREDLAAYPMDVLRDAVRNLRRSEHFFPNVARMIEYAAEVTAQRRASARELPPPAMTPEKMTRNARLAYLLRRKMDGDKEAAQEFDRLLNSPVVRVWR